MRTTLIQMAAVGILAAAPAWAQNAKSPQSDQNGMQQGGQQGGKSSTQSRQETLRGELTQNLKQAGFTDVSVAPDSFLVHAKDKNGNPVAMFFNPNSMTEITAVRASVDQTQGGKFANLPSHEELSTKAVGANVYNSSNQEIGSIKDLAIENSRVKAYIVKVDVGNGERFVAVKPSALKLTYNSSDKSWRGELDASKQELQSAPEFKYSAAM